MARRYPEIYGNTAFTDEHLAEEHMDALSAALIRMLIEGTDMDKDEIYSLVFKDGREIVWH